MILVCIECYETENGVEQNYSLAVQHYEHSSKSGDELSCYNLAKLYELGLGVNQSFEKALEYYWLAEKGGKKPIILLSSSNV